MTEFQDGNQRNDWLGWLISTAAGLVLWSYANWNQGTREPWDGPNYYTLHLPLALLLCFVLGASFPERPWRWASAVMMAQLPVMIFAGSGVGPFLIIGLGVLASNALIGALPAYLGSAIGRRLRRNRNDTH